MTELVETGIPGLDSLLRGGLPEGSCLLLIAPPKAETHLFCLEFLYRGTEMGEPALMVTMDSSPEMLKKKGGSYSFDLEAKEGEGLFKWVDGYSIHSNKDVESTENVERVGGPMALTDTSIALSRLQARLHGEHGYYRFIFDSISTLLIYNSPETVYRFLEVIVAKTRSSGGVGFFVLGEGMHDKKVEMVIRHMMDGTVHIKDNLEIEALSLPTPGELKKGELKLSEDGFSVEMEEEEVEKRSWKEEVEKMAMAKKEKTAEVGVWEDSKRGGVEDVLEKNAAPAIEAIGEKKFTEEELERMLKKEKKGKGRKTVVSAIESRLEEGK